MNTALSAVFRPKTHQNWQTEALNFRPSTTAIIGKDISSGHEYLTDWHIYSGPSHGTTLQPPNSPCARNHSCDSQHFAVWWAGDLIPVGRFTALIQTGPGSHPALCAVGTGSLLLWQRPDRGVDNKPPSSDEVEERVWLNFYPPPTVGLQGLFSAELYITFHLSCFYSGTCLVSLCHRRRPDGFFVGLRVYCVCFLGKWPTWRTILFCVLIYIFNSTCFEHIVLIIRRDKLCQYNIW